MPEEGGDRVGALGHNHTHAVAWAHTPGDEESRDPIGALVEFTVGQAPPGGIDDRDTFGATACARFEIVDEAGPNRRGHGVARFCARLRSTNAAMSSMRSKLSMSVSWASTSI